MLKIALSGVQCTGKTTILNEMQKNDLYKDFLFYKECIRDLKKKGLKINEEGNDETQIQIMNMHQENLKKCTSLNRSTIFDRCALDGMCYTEYLYNHNQINQQTYEECKKIYNDNIILYDYIIYLKPEFELINDGVRSLNLDFRNEVSQIFERYIKDIKSIKDIPIIIELHGNIEERMNKIKEIIF